MRVRILRLQAGARAPFATPAQVDELPHDESLCVFSEISGPFRLGGWWPQCFRSTLRGSVFGRRAGLWLRIGGGSFQVCHSGPGPELDVPLGGSAVFTTWVPAPDLMRRLAQPYERDSAAGPQLFSARYGTTQGYWRLHQLGAECFGARSDAIDDHGAMERVLAAVAEAQSAFEPYLQRCPGRKPEQRRELFARLQRVRGLFDTDFYGDSTIERLAELASLSPSRFVNVYRHVFGETPHKALARAKLKRAFDVLGDGSRAMTDVAHQLGFESRCAFARWIKSETGMSPTELRASLGRVALPPSADERTYTRRRRQPA
ncbi:MAG TPA: AraC family transcriptional regulator [Xanthomonadales bacterium]|nr:AraC family transcriptional regulator [Xanthomonadales bacterium]